MRQTGYFGRATEDGHKAMVTKHIHFVEDGEQPICGYKPHKTMEFQFCTVGFDNRYVSCPRCIKKKERIINEG